MTAEATLPVAPSQEVAEGNGPEVLDRISAPGCAAAVWRRRPLRHFQDWIDGLSPETLPEARIALSPDRVDIAMGALFSSCGIADGPFREMLVKDIAALSILFARVMRAETIRLRLDVIDGDACTKFHIDHVPARLLCTYRGPGTEFGRSDGGEDPHDIDRLETGSVGLFRGRLSPGGEMPGISHRSPPIAGLGEARLLLVIDPVYDAA